MAKKNTATTNLNALFYYVGGFITYYVSTIPVVIVLDSIPSWNTKWKFYEHFYRSQNYYTEYFAFSKFFYWMTMLVVGFTFVNIVNLNNERHNPFKSRDGSYKDIKKLIPVGTVMFFLSPIMLLLGKYDRAGFCNQEDAQLPGGLEDITGKCEIYTLGEVNHYNYVYWTLAYYVGLNFTHMDTPPFNQMTLEWDIMKTWPLFIWEVFGLLVLAIVLNIAYVFYIDTSVHKLTFYLVFLAAEIVYFVGMTRHYKGKRVFHMHHYVLMMSLIPFLANQSEYETTLLGLLSGVFVEGITRWGFDPIWIPDDSQKELDIEQRQQIATLPYSMDQALIQAPTFVVLDNGVIKYMQ